MKKLIRSWVFLWSKPGFHTPINAKEYTCVAITAGSIFLLATFLVVAEKLSSEYGLALLGITAGIAVIPAIVYWCCLFIAWAVRFVTDEQYKPDITTWFYPRDTKIVNASMQHIYIAWIATWVHIFVAVTIYVILPTTGKLILLGLAGTAGLIIGGLLVARFVFRVSTRLDKHIKEDH